MVVVIPYKEVGNKDLYYSVKLIEKFYKPLEDIVIIGDKPLWYKGSYIPCKDEKDKEYSIYKKLKMFRGECLFTNDDIFFLREIENIPNYYKGFCKDAKPTSKYYLNMYQNCPLDWLDFDVHCPMVLNTRRLKWMGQMPLKSQYGNRNNLEGTFTKDFKIRSLEELDLNRDFLSTTNKLSPLIESHLETLIEKGV